MADPVSITASIVAILQISLAVIQISHQYTKDIKDSQKSITRVIDELTGLNSVLFSLCDLARGEGDINTSRLLNLGSLLEGPESPLRKCQEELQNLQSKLSRPASGLKGLGKTLLWPLKDKETQRTLDVIRAQKTTCDLALSIDNTALSLNIHDNVRALSEDFAAATFNEKRQKVIEWYSAVDPESNHLAACEKRESTTGDWFLSCAEFEAWLNTPKSFIWLHGIPGCGKTVLSSTIIEKVLRDYGNTPNIAVAYFYFDFAETKKQNIRSCLSSLLAQICRQRNDIPAEVMSDYDRRKSSTGRPLIPNLLNMISAATEGLEVFLILDALDECAERENLLEVLSTISLGNCGNFKVLTTSRRERDIEVAILPISSNNMSIEDAKIKADIRLFVVNSVAKDSKMNRWPAGVKAEVESTLVEGAKGMFRWVKCQLDVLRTRTRVRDVRKALNLLPPTLDETYERVLLTIDRDDREQVRIALQWLCFSARPLRLQEIAEAVVIDPKEDTFSPEDRLFEPHDIVNICRSLVSLKDDTSELRLAHFSVQEYLVSDRIREGPVSFFSVFEEPTQSLLAEACLSYIFLFDKPQSLSEHSLSEWPLLGYVCRHWPHHVRRITTLSSKASQHHAIAMAKELFEPGRKLSFFNWLRVSEPDRSWTSFDPHKNPISFATPLYYASICDLLDVASSLIENGANVTARGGRFIHPVNAAASCNSYALTRLLIQNGAEVNITDEGGWKPIHNASMHNNADITRLLIEAGAELEVRDLAGGGPMHIACHDGHISTIRVLVEYGTEIDCRAQFTRDDLCENRCMINLDN